jgi:hypothetical protein
LNLDQFHHGIRAARDALRQQGSEGVIVIVGSQSILASYSDRVLDDTLTVSAEIDVVPVASDRAEIERLADELDGSLGQDSTFSASFGFHVDGVSLETAKLPIGWIDRLIPAVDPATGSTGWCLDPHDLAASKLIAGRPKDLDFVRVLVRTRLVDPDEVGQRIETIDDPRRSRATERLEAIAPLGIGAKERAAWRMRRDQANADRRARTSEPSPALVLSKLQGSPRDRGAGEA